MSDDNIQIFKSIEADQQLHQHQLTKYATDKEIYVGMATNGTLNTEDFAQKISK